MAEFMVAESTEDPKALSSEDDEEVGASQEPESLLPPSVLDQASVIAELFVSSVSRRSSLALEDGKSSGFGTPRLTSRSSSMVSLDDGEKGPAHVVAPQTPWALSSFQKWTSALGWPQRANLLSMGQRPRAQAAQRSQTGLLAQRNRSFPLKTGSCWTESRGTTKMQSTKMQALVSGAGRASPSSPKGL